jgi:hypothetical protein
MTRGAEVGAFDAIGEDQLAQALEMATVEQLGRELARRVEKLAAAVDDAERTAQDSDDVLVIAGAAAMATYSAAAAGDYSQAVCVLIGKGDLALTNRSLHLASRARRHAERTERRWADVKARKGGAS